MEDTHPAQGAQEASTRVGVCRTHSGQIRACAPFTALTCAHTPYPRLYPHASVLLCAHSPLRVRARHGLPLVTTSPVASQKGLCTAVPPAGSRAAWGPALSPREVSFPLLPQVPSCPGSFLCPAPSGIVQLMPGEAGPGTVCLLRSPPSGGSTPLSVGCDCSFPAVPPVGPVPTLHFGGLAL